MFTHPNIHKQSWTSLDRKTHSQIDHILIERGLRSSIHDVRLFRELSVILISLVFPIVRERFVVCKQATHTFDVKRFNLR